MVNVIIVAAGTGSRFGSDLPKQFHIVPSTGQTVIAMTVGVFMHALPDARIVVVVSEGMENHLAGLDVTVVHGGPTRFHSVANALDIIDAPSGDIILVHDGARPLIDCETIGRVVDALADSPAVVPVVSVNDSLRIIHGDGSSHSVDRARFRAVQTPQGFDARILKNAYSAVRRTDFTDDASVVEAAGISVVTVEGNPLNIKITDSGDLDRVSLLATSS